MENLSNANGLLSIDAAAITAAELIAALANPFDGEDAELLRSLGIAPIESDGTN